MKQRAWAMLVIGLGVSPLGCGGAQNGVRPPLTVSSSPQERVGWVESSFVSKVVMEASAGIEAGTLLQDGAPLLGAQLRFGTRYSLWQSNDTTWSGKIQEAVVGDAWGLDMRVRELWADHTSSGIPTWATASIAVVADNALGDDNGESRVRVPSLLGFVLPEIGIMISRGALAGFLVSHSVPLAVLLTRRVALEARPSFTLRFAETDAQEPDALLSLSLGLMVR